MSRDRLAAVASAVVGALSIVYAVSYLVVTPAVQRGTDVGAAYTSYLAHPTGARLAALCLCVSGLLTTLVFAGLYAQPGRLAERWRTWALVVGVVSGVATSAHGLADLVNTDKLAHAYADGDAATRAAVIVARSAPSPVDPRGLATFGLVGLVVFAFAWHLRPGSPRLAILGQVLGVDMVLLFLASAFTLAVPTLVTGALAAVLLGPAWWFWLSVRVARAAPVALSAPAPAATEAR